MLYQFAFAFIRSNGETTETGLITSNESSTTGTVTVSRFTPIEKVLHAVAIAHDCEGKELLAAGRQQGMARPRAQLVDLARHWCAMKATEVAHRLHRDPSMVSRLCGIYETARDASLESTIGSAIDT